MFEGMIGQSEYLVSIPVRARFVKVNQKNLKDMKNLVPGEGMLTLDQSACSWLTATAYVHGTSFKTCNIVVRLKSLQVLAIFSQYYDCKCSKE